MEGFTLGLALVDAIPVLAFAGSMGIIAARFDSPLFMIGAGLSILAGCCKVAWKLILGIWKKDVRWLNKPFVPMQATGFLLMLISFILGFRRISWAGVLGALVSFPAVLFFVIWIFLNIDIPNPFKIFLGCFSIFKHNSLVLYNFHYIIKRTV